MDLPRHFGRYLLADKIATGGMAEIFEARLIGVEGFEKPIAIKQILPHWSEKSDFAAMLIDEAKIAVRLNHPNIIQVYELGKEAEQYYIAMELIDGIDLRELQKICHVSGQKIPLELTLWIIQEVAQALVYAHELKDAEGRPLEIIHRDISPQNVLISYDGQVKVTDFGIAKAADRSHETVTGQFKGKFAYMSPEQANQKKIDQRSDLFSLGIVFYEMVTSHRLFSDSTDISVLDKVRQSELPKNDRDFNAQPASVRALILSLLSKNLKDRPSNAAQVRDQIKKIMTQLKLVCDRQDLARFLRALLKGRIEERHERNIRLSKRLKEFLKEGRGEAKEDVTRTAVPLPKGRRDFTQVLVTDWKKAVHSGYWRDRISLQRSLWIGSGVILVLVLVLAWIFLDRQPVRETVLQKDTKESLTLRTPPEAESKAPMARTEPNIRNDQVVPMQLELEEAKSPSEEAKPGAEMKKKADSKEEKKAAQSGGFGWLNVQAVPWGYVYAGTSGRRYETPIKGLKLPVGKQTLQVHYPPTGDRLRRTVNIRLGRRLTCIARFGGNRGLKCY